MTDKRTSPRTRIALLSRGLDTTVVDRLIEQGHNVASLQALTFDELLSLGLNKEQAQSFTSAGRPPIPEDTLNEVLYKSRWTCCICRDASKGIIVHHLEPWSDSRSHAEGNLVVLCLDHHGEAHTKRELSLSLNSERIRQARDKWYAEARDASQQEAAKVVKLISGDHRLSSTHRGAMSWGDNSVAVYGNDGYKPIDDRNPDPKIVRTHRQIQLLRKVLANEGLQELAFATSDSHGTWVLLVRSSDVSMLGALVWACFMKALEEQTGVKFESDHDNAAQ